MKKLVLIALVIAAPAMAKSADWRVHKVELGGTKYTIRHHLTDDTAMVFFGSPKRMSAALYMEMKAASEQATGCTVKDSFPRGSVLDVALDCDQ